MEPIDNPIRSLAIGAFDGMHVAHRRLIERSDAVAVIEHSRATLTPGYKRCWYCEKPCHFYFLERIRGMEPAAFVEWLRRDFPGLERIVVGFDFRFGKNRSAGVEELERLFDGEVEVLEEVTVAGIPVHSRTIRELLAQGDLQTAHRLLGRNYRIDGERIPGQGIGSSRLVPTINLAVEGYQLPRAGVYASWSEIGGERYPSVSFIGVRESTDGSFAVETHLIDTEIGTVSGRVFVEFFAYLRPNRRFENLDALKTAIEADIAAARKLLLG
ncbi:bifunctional riboflavin kinase/FAD synthetase [Nitratifractor sp.]